MRDLAARERFEEASVARDRFRALAEGLARARTDRWLLGAGEVELREADDRRLRIRGGALVRDGTEPAIPLPCPRDRADEVAALRSWLARNPVRLLQAERPLAEPVDGGAALHRLLACLRAAERRPA